MEFVSPGYCAYCGAGDPGRLQPSRFNDTVAVRYMAPTRKGETMGLRQAQRDVRGLIRSRVPFDSIEDRIDSIPGLDDHQRAALWLYAWSRQGHGWQRATADQLLEWAGGSP